jgi:hypothetical protein
MQLLWLPAIQEQLALNEKNPASALNIQQAAQALKANSCLTICPTAQECERRNGYCASPPNGPRNRAFLGAGGCLAAKFGTSDRQRLYGTQSNLRGTVAADELHTAANASKLILIAAKTNPRRAQ